MIKRHIGPFFEGTAAELIAFTVAPNGSLYYVTDAGEDDPKFYAYAGSLWREIGSGSNNGTGFVIEDLTSQIDGLTDTFDTTYNIVDIRVYYNGLHQANITINPDTLSFTLDFIPQVGDTLVVDYQSLGYETGFTFTALTDTPNSYAGQAGKAVKVNPGETGLEFGDAAPATHTHVGGDITSKVSDSDKVDGQHAADFATVDHVHVGVGELVKISNDDTNAGYLADKISAGDNITLAVLNPGANEQLQITSTGGGGGGPTDAKYVVGAAHVDLSDEIVIPGMMGVLDRAGLYTPNTAAVVSEEFDGADPLTWSSAPTANDCNITIPSHYYVKVSDTTLYLGLQNWSPPTDRTVGAVAKIAMGTDGGASVGHVIAMCFMNSNNTAGVRFGFYRSASSYITGVQGNYLNGGVWSLAGGLVSTYNEELYFKITYNNGTVMMYYSPSGKLWKWFSTTNITNFTIAKIGLAISGNVTQPIYAAVDFIRTSD